MGFLVVLGLGILGYAIHHLGMRGSSGVVDSFTWRVPLCRDRRLHLVSLCHEAGGTTGDRS